MKQIADAYQKNVLLPFFFFLPDRQKLKSFLKSSIINIYNIAGRYGNWALIPYMEETRDWYRLFMETNFENTRI